MMYLYFIHYFFNYVFILNVLLLNNVNVIIVIPIFMLKQIKRAI